MKRLPPLSRTIIGSSLFFGVVAAVGCGSNDDGSQFVDPNGSSSGNDLTASSSSGSSGFGTSGGTSGTSGGAPCTGLACNQVACTGTDVTTTLSGQVFDPSGTVPLYNAIVYVPNAPLDPFVEGITCDKCGTTPSGKPITTALSDSTGHFTLKNVPVGVDVPVVIQIGRWRRQVTIPGATVNKCADATLGVEQTRLPRSKAEGDIPKIAITTGNADSLECFVRKLGIGDEMTDPTGTGRVHIYQGVRGGAKGSNITASTPVATTLFEDAAKMKTYDMMIFSCEGGENATETTPTALANVQDYLDKGGRLFASHYHYQWFKKGSDKFQSTAAWLNTTTEADQPITVDQTFAKGVAFSEWLDEVKATTAPKSGAVAMTELKKSITAVPGVNGTADTSRRWLYSPAAPKFYSFNTPVGAAVENQCGRGVFTDIHVSSGDDSTGTFPMNCKTTGFTPQEKALLFLLFDLASCIQDDNTPPAPPPPAVVR